MITALSLSVFWLAYILQFLSTWSLSALYLSTLLLPPFCMFITWLSLVMTHVGYNTALVQIDQCSIHTVPYMCAGASIAAAPLIALSLLAPEYQQSFAALLIGFALSETWRAPAAVLIREVSPPELGATGSALHLCIRNLVGGCGPLSKRLYS